jgi:hypothetical protein
VSFSRIEPARVRPGGAFKARARLVNTGSEPLHVLLNREDEPRFMVHDPSGFELPTEYPEPCDIAGTLVHAAFALVVLEPGGTVDVTWSWKAVHRALAPSDRSGEVCAEAPGSPLEAGKYRLKWYSHAVWDFSEKSFEADFEVR